ncbi:MAG: CYTH domain-containing protein [Colwellia sp.]|nr:CYTH domain-containing protein [Colwellia sp.]
MVTEIELKYSLLECRDMATEQQVKAQICQLLTEQELSFVHQVKQLSNHYFDTEGLVLRQQRIALRTRGTKSLHDEVRFEQTIKTSGTVIAGLHQRPEYNVDIDDAKPILALFPEKIWRPATDIKQLQLDIVELFSTNFTRHTWLVTLSNAQVEIAFDSGEVACQGHRNKPRIYEIELELVSGDTQALFVLTKLLFSQLALRPGQLTKAARGYALYHESINACANLENIAVNDDELVEPIALSMIDLPKNSSLDSAFSKGIEYSITQLQLSVDGYVDAPSLFKLAKISELLALLRQGFWLFNELLPAKKSPTEEQALRSELSYFIRTIHWVDNARYIQALTSKRSSNQKAASVNQELITKLQLTQQRYPNESQVLAILHSERFNNLQLNLLSLLLKRNSADTHKADNSSSLIEFSAKHLTQSSKVLSCELAKLKKPQSASSSELYLTAHSLLIRALLTTSWFAGLFSDSESELVNKFSMPWLDIKQGISELQSLSLLQQQLVHLPTSEPKLAQWLTNKSDNLITALDQSRAKALTMKPYWS